VRRETEGEMEKEKDKKMEQSVSEANAALDGCLDELMSFINTHKDDLDPKTKLPHALREKLQRSLALFEAEHASSASSH
jgi:hypothetical protein